MKNGPPGKTKTSKNANHSTRDTPQQRRLNVLYCPFSVATPTTSLNFRCRPQPWLGRRRSHTTRLPRTALHPQTHDAIWRCRVERSDNPASDGSRRALPPPTGLASTHSCFKQVVSSRTSWPCGWDNLKTLLTRIGFVVHRQATTKITIC